MIPTSRNATADATPRIPVRIERLALGVALAAATLTSACQQTETPSGEVLRTVRTMVIEAEGEGRLRTFSGTSRSSQESRLSFKVAGTLDSLPVEVGDRLAAGDLIAALVPDQYELEVERAQSDVARALANLRNAEASYERTKELYADNNAARSDLDATRANAESAQAQVTASERQLELARLNLSYTRLRASQDCSVASVEVEVNENVGSGNPVATVTCGDELEVELAIPASLVQQLNLGMPASVRFDALGDREFDGEVSQIGVVARDGATFPVTVRLAPPSDGSPTGASALRAGLAAEVGLRFGDGSEGTVLVPLSAVVESDGATFVFLSEPSAPGEAVVTQRGVEIGELTDRGLEVRSGLATGDRVITAGTAVIRDGMRVRSDGPPSAAETETEETAGEAQ